MNKAGQSFQAEVVIGIKVWTESSNIIAQKITQLWNAVAFHLLAHINQIRFIAIQILHWIYGLAVVVGAIFWTITWNTNQIWIYKRKIMLIYRINSIRDHFGNSLFRFSVDIYLFIFDARTKLTLCMAAKCWFMSISMPSFNSLFVPEWMHSFSVLLGEICSRYCLPNFTI